MMNVQPQRQRHISKNSSNGSVGYPNINVLDWSMNAETLSDMSRRSSSLSETELQSINDGLIGETGVTETKEHAQFSSCHQKDGNMQKKRIRGRKDKIRERKGSQMGNSDEMSLRFHLDTGTEFGTNNQEYNVRAIRLRKSSTVVDILPVLKQTFQLQMPPLKLRVIKATDFGEVELAAGARPLDIALNSTEPPRFIIRAAYSDMNLDRNTNINYRKDKHFVRNVLPQDTQSCPDYDNNYRNTRLTFSEPHHGRHHESNLAFRANLTPDLVGDCKRKPIIPSANYASSTESLEYWGKKRSQIIASDSNLNNPPGSMSNSNISVSFHESTPSVASDSRSGRSQKKNDASSRSRSRQRRSRSRESSEERESEFKTNSKRGSSLRSSKSMSSLFQKSFSLRKKENPFKPNTELSTEEKNPGILKIFGESLSPGANYKSVLAVATSTAKELVKEALERYGVPRKKSGQFVLCDVIGRFMNYSSDIEGDDSMYSLSPDNGLWTEECIRIIGDNERPLVLQNYWKPAEGYARRFEVRRRSDLMVIEDTYTCGVNSNARRMLASRSRSDTVSEICENIIQDDDGQTDEPRSYYENESVSSEKCNGSPRVRLKAPQSCPFLLNLDSYNPNEDCLILPISHRCVKVGSNQKLITGKHIYFSAPDIFLKHCEFRLSARRLAAPNSGKGDIAFTVQLHVHAGAAVTINNITVQKPTILQSGDLVRFGEHYLFLFKDPCCNNPAKVSLSQTPNHQETEENREEPTPTDIHPCHTTPYTSPETKATIQWRLRRNLDYNSDSTHLKLSYCLEREDELLQNIINLVDEGTDAFKLTPAYMLSMAVEYSATKYDQMCTRALLLKLAAKIHNSVLRKARRLAEQQSIMPHDPHTVTDNLLFSLSPIIQWMTNALELHHHFQRNLGNYLMDPQLSLGSRTRASIATAGDEVMGTLEEVVMYTFQQTIYYLTKALYICLPALADSNPFHDKQSDGETPSTNQQVIKVYQITLDYLHEYKLHPKVISQLFCYLFFFTSTSVFNNLMNREKYFRWARGVQLRGNLDCLETWAAENNLIDEASRFMKKITCLTNLLATPKIQLLKSSWSSICQSFPDLRPAQLHHVLSQYEGGIHSQLVHWQPTEDIQGTKADDLLESFDGHPPLTFPMDGFHLDLSKEVVDLNFSDILEDFNSTFGIFDDDVDSGLSVSQKGVNNDIQKQNITPNNISSDNTESNESSTDQHQFKRSTSSISSPLESWTSSLGSNSDYFLPKQNPNSSLGSFVENQPNRLNGDHVPMTCNNVIRRKSAISHTQDSSPFSGISGSTRSLESHVSPAESVHSFRPITHVKSSPHESFQYTNNSNHTNGQNPQNNLYDMEESSQPINPHYSPGNPEISTLEEAHPHMNGGESIRDAKTIRNSPRVESFRSDHPVSRMLTYTDSVRYKSSSMYNTSAKNDYPQSQGPQQSFSVEQNHNNKEEHLYMNVPFRTSLHPESSVSLNSSMSSQASRDGKEVYSYMKNTVQITEGSPKPVIPQEPIKPAPVLQKHSGLHPNKQPQFETAVYDDNRNEIFVDDMIPQQNYHPQVRLKPLGASSDDPNIKGSHGDGGSCLSDDLTTSASSLLQTIHRIPHNNHFITKSHKYGQNTMHAIDIPRGSSGFGLGLIDGMHTSLGEPGIYVRTLVSGSPAQQDGRLQLGDRILKVNGSNIVGADYSSVMKAIKYAGDSVQLMITRSKPEVIQHITASPC